MDRSSCQDGAASFFPHDPFPCGIFRLSYNFEILQNFTILDWAPIFLDKFCEMSFEKVAKMKKTEHQMIQIKLGFQISVDFHNLFPFKNLNTATYN